MTICWIISEWHSNKQKKNLRINKWSKFHKEPNLSLKSNARWDLIEYSLLCKLIRNILKADLGEYWHKTLFSTAQEKQSLRKCQWPNNEVQISALRKSNGPIIRTVTGIEWECQGFYTNLFTSKVLVALPTNQPTILIIRHHGHAGWRSTRHSWTSREWQGQGRDGI